MFLEHNLKKLWVAGVSLLSLGLTAFPATAKVPANLCPSADQISVVQVDEKTVICRFTRQPLRSFGVEDILVLYRYCKKGNWGSKVVSNMTVMNFYTNDTNTVTITERKSCSPSLQTNSFRDLRTTSFRLRGRKFEQWLYPEEEDAELMNRYSRDVTQLLNASEKFPAKPTF